MVSRVWDRYLTQQDRRDLERRGPRERVHRGARPCLLLLDLYRWVFGDEPLPLEQAVEHWPGSCGLAAWDALPHIAELLEAARLARVPVVHTTEKPDSAIAGWARSRNQGGVADAQWQGRFDIVDPLKPINSEVLLIKETPSPFWGTPLLLHLISLHVDTLVVAGESTSGCVRATVVDAATHRFDVVVAEECVFDRHELPHAANLFDIHQKYGDVMALTQVRELLVAETG